MQLVDMFCLPDRTMFADKLAQANDAVGVATVLLGVWIDDDSDHVCFNTGRMQGGGSEIDAPVAQESRKAVCVCSAYGSDDVRQPTVASDTSKGVFGVRRTVGRVRTGAVDDRA